MPEEQRSFFVRNAEGRNIEHLQSSWCDAMSRSMVNILACIETLESGAYIKANRPKLCFIQTIVVCKIGIKYLQ